MFKLRLLTAVIVCLLVTGCSTRGLVYNQLDWLIPWYVDDYVELDNAQSSYLDQQLTPFLNWHRQQELPRYSALLSRIESDLDSKLEAETIRQWLDQILQAVLRSQRRLTEVGIMLIERLDDEQIMMLKQRLLQRQDELEETYRSRTDDEYAEATCQRVQDRLVEYLGYLQREQQLLLEDACSQLVRFDHAWLDERRTWLNGLLPLFERQAGWQQQVRTHIGQRYKLTNEAYNKALSHNLSRLTDAIAAILNRCEASQRQHLSTQLARLQSDLRQLNQT